MTILFSNRLDSFSCSKIFRQQRKLISNRWICETNEWRKKIDCAFLNRSQNSKRKRNCFCVNFQLCRKIRKMNFVCQKKMIQLSFDFDCKSAKRYSFILHTNEKIKRFDQWISMNRMISCLTKMIIEKKEF